MKQAIILDTDIGSDIDDALALAYLLRHPDCELVGITTVTGEPGLRASLCDALCRTAGRDDVPIHVGVAEPILGHNHQPHVPQASALERWPHAKFEDRVTAIEFLRETIRSRPGEITLLTIGPLTNIAVLLAVDPEIATLVKGIVMMGGQFTKWTEFDHTLAEWNIRCDPIAAQKVFASPIPITAAGYEITTQCRIESSKAREQLQRPGVPGLVADMAEVWLHHASHIVFHDPLAATLLFETGICQTVTGTIEVELTSPRAAGATYFTRSKPGETARHTVVNAVDVRAFYEHYFGVVAGG